MMYKYLEPEVAVSLGDNTVMDSSIHPPKVQKLHLVFEGWSGDCLIECFPCFAMTEEAKLATDSSGLSGVKFQDLKVSKSEQFDGLYQHRQLPTFYWAQIDGVAGQDDFGIAEDFRLVVSGRALQILQLLDLKFTIISNFSYE